ncbi:MAG: hypothetical protein ACRDMI_09305 [Streptosporangiaceae bacterium]
MPTTPLASSSGTVAYAATRQKYGRARCAERRRPLAACWCSSSMTGPTTASSVMAISPGMISATSPTTTIRAASRSARISEPQGSERSTSRIRLPSAPCSSFPCSAFPWPGSPCSAVLTSRHRKPDRNTAPSRLTDEVDREPTSAVVTSARSRRWSAANSTATVTADTTIETARIRHACRRAVCTTAAAIGRNRSVGSRSVMTRHAT